jgi:hypothetical protein
MKFINSIKDRLRDQLCWELRIQSIDQLKNQLDDQLLSQLSDQLNDQLVWEVRAQLWDQLYIQLSDELQKSNTR